MEFCEIKKMCQSIWNPVIEFRFDTVSRFAKAVKVRSNRALKALVSSFWHESELEIDQYETYKTLFSLFDKNKFSEYEHELVDLWFPEL